MLINNESTTEVGEQIERCGELMKKVFQEEERIKPKKNFRRAWSAVAQAHSRTLHRRGWGREQRKEKKRGGFRSHGDCLEKKYGVKTETVM